ncbi:MAG: DNA alkylation repair protein [Rikenellaceae bacterium]
MSTPTQFSNMEVVTTSENQPTNGSRLAYLLGEMRRQMNGAVVGSMRFYGEEYGLNYGVSLPTIRSIARAESEATEDAALRHRFAKLLYRQEVRELRLAALWLADSPLIDEELDFWAKGIINSEVAEEAAFSLLYQSSRVEGWLDGESELLQYCALLAIAKRDEIGIESYLPRIKELMGKQIHIIQNGVVALLESALKKGSDRGNIESFLASLPDGNFVREEMSWRIEFL